MRVKSKVYAPLKTKKKWQRKLSDMCGGMKKL